MAAPAAVVAVKAAPRCGNGQTGKNGCAFCSCGASGAVYFNHCGSPVCVVWNGKPQYFCSEPDISWRVSVFPDACRIPDVHRKDAGEFSDLDGVLTDINDMAEGGTVDGYRVKSIFILCFSARINPVWTGKITGLLQIVL